MHTVIEAVRSAGPVPFLRRPSSIRLSADAGRRVLEAAGDSSAVDLVVNVGVYREQNIYEPALAALIQRRIPTLAARTDVMSLDLANGACGLLTGLEVVDAFIRAGSVRRALVVASDIDPDPSSSRGLSVRPRGAAIVAGAGNGREGFLAFQSDTFPEHGDLYEVRLEWQGAGRLLGRGAGHAVAVRAAADYAERCAASAAVSVVRFLEAHDLALGDVDVVVVADVPERFLGRLTAMLDLPPERVVDDATAAGGYTAAPALALEAAVASGRWRAARRALLVAVGAGITVSLALYGREGCDRGA